MPRTTFPPTPASSTDIQGKDGSKQLASLQMSFELPPPAMTGSDAAAAAASADVNMMSPPMPPETATASSSKSKSAYPVQAAEVVKSRRRSSTASTAKDSFSLPPPPTRSRKIIQMKPRTAAASGSGEDESSISALQRPIPSGASGKNAPKHGALATAETISAAPSTAAPAAAAGKKKPSATSAAGRKIARKTAHSLIERRRRSKMNEEFAVLKGMIPACTGEMHKLAILQASIEYVRYLEDCVATLKAQRESEHGNTAASSPTDGLPTPSGRAPYNPDQSYPSGYADEQLSPDVEMAGTGEGGDDDDYDDDNNGSNLPSPSSSHSTTHQPSTSPALLAQDALRQQRHDSQSSTASMPMGAASTAGDHHRHYSYSYNASAQTSPAFGPQPYLYAHSTAASVAGSTLTSPALPPQRDLDQEATAALLMLNSDRRGAGGGNDNGKNQSGRGMSVRDLLST